MTALHVASYRGLNNTVRNLCLRKKVKVDEQDEVLLHIFTECVYLCDNYLHRMG